MRAAPNGATEIDLSGLFVSPGLIDSHVHLGTQQRDSGVIESILHLAFMGGITTVRDMGGSMRIVQPLAARSSSDTSGSPR